MRYARPAGVIGIAAALLMVLGAAAGPALAADLPLVSSTTYASALDDGFTCVTTGTGGAVYAAGYTERNASQSQGQLVLVKYVDDGTALTKAWQAGAGSQAGAAAVALDPLGNVVVAGTRGRLTDFHGNSDILVLKYSPDGELIWTATYDGPAHGLDYAKAMAIDVHGNVLVCGASFGRRTGRDYITLKLRAATGAVAWARRYAGPSDFDEARDVTVDPSGNVYVTGQSRSKASKPGRSGPPGAVTISYTAGGKKRWIVVDRRRPFATGDAIDYTGAGGVRSVVFTGSRGREQTYFQKRRTNGKLLWSRTLDPTRYPSGWGAAAALDADGAPVAVGIRNGDGGIEGWVAGVSPTGRAPWTSTIASAYDNPSWAELGAVAVAADGRVLAVGDIGSSDMGALDDSIPTTFLVRFGANWPITAPLDYIGDGGATTHDQCTAAAIGDKGMYAVGKSAKGDNDSDAVLLKF